MFTTKYATLMITKTFPKNAENRISVTGGAFPGFSMTKSEMSGARSGSSSGSEASLANLSRIT